MFAKAFIGSRKYHLWLACLLAVIGVGAGCYLVQFSQGLVVTDLSRDVSWGFYVAQYSFLVGVAASMGMALLPCQLLDRRRFGRIVILGELLAVAAGVACALFLFVDLGQPLRALQLLLHPTPASPMFWDMALLAAYLPVVIVLARHALRAERHGLAPPPWAPALIYLAIPLAVGLRVVTADVFCGLAGRPYWQAPVMPWRFLVSALAAGPALLVVLGLILRRLTGFEAGREALNRLANIALCATILNVCLVLFECFTAFHGGAAGDRPGLQHLFFGLRDGGQFHGELVPWSWTAALLAGGSALLLLIPKLRRSETWLAAGCLGLFVASWIDQSLALVVAGFIPSPLETVTSYSPTAIELAIALGIYAIGALILTLLYKIATTVKQEIEA